LTIINLLIAETFRVHLAGNGIAKAGQFSPQCFLIHESAFWRDRVAALASYLS
jgi:hypothetical protein